MTEVALDLEEVLADTIHEACHSTGKLTIEDFETWDISDYTWQVYSGVSDALWRHDPLSIPPVEPNLSEYVGQMHRKCHTLDIVTARLHVDDKIEAWLSHHSIPFDNIVSTQKPKYELGYDVFIDDNPEMFNECRLLLRHHSHNEHLDAAGSKTTDRIHSLEQAVEFIK